MDRWEELRAGKLKLPAIVQSDVSGVLIAMPGSGYIGPFEERKGWTVNDYVALGEQLAAMISPPPEPDYRAKYEDLKAAIASIDPKATKEAIVTKLQAAKAIIAADTVQAVAPQEVSK